MLNIFASVILCTHNPREDYLRRTIEALRAQTLPMDQWELLLIDNASEAPLAGRFDVSWHPRGRHIREEELGLTAARLRGIQEAEGEPLIFVDDDTLLSSDYFEQAIVVGEQWPFVGVWGGDIAPEFEVPPPDWCQENAWRLTIANVTEDIWSNLREGFTTVPAGAGMCIRKKVGRRFVEWRKMNKNSNVLGRKGASLSGYEDVDLAHCAMDLGLGTGKSTRLHLTHLIPPSRLTLDWFLRHAEGDAASLMMFRAIRGLPVEPPKNSFVVRLQWRFFRLVSRKPPETFKILEAYQRGLETGWKLVQEYKAQHRQNAK